MAEPAGGPDVRALPGDAVTLVDTSFDRGSIGEVRANINECARGSGLTDLSLSNFVLAANEIVTNAVRHGGGAGQLQIWRHNGSLWCQVTDQGRGIPRARLSGSHKPRPGRIGGWGLWLARQICHRVDIDTSTSGTRVLLQYTLPPSQ